MLLLQEEKSIEHILDDMKAKYQDAETQLAKAEKEKNQAESSLNQLKSAQKGLFSEISKLCQ